MDPHQTNVDRSDKHIYQSAAITFSNRPVNSNPLRIPPIQQMIYDLVLHHAHLPVQSTSTTIFEKYCFVPLKQTELTESQDCQPILVCDLP